MHVIRRASSMSYPQVARFLGRSDHTTAMYADRNIAAERVSDPAFDVILSAIEDEAKAVRRPINFEEVVEEETRNGDAESGNAGTE
jgi:hypothetical protein